MFCLLAPVEKKLGYHSCCGKVVGPPWLIHPALDMFNNSQLLQVHDETHEVPNGVTSNNNWGRTKFATVGFTTKKNCLYKYSVFSLFCLWKKICPPRLNLDKKSGGQIFWNHWLEGPIYNLIHIANSQMDISFKSVIDRPHVNPPIL